MLRRFAISCLCVALAAPMMGRTRPHYGGTLHAETEGDGWQRPGGLARRLVFDGLTELNARGEVGPALATDWSADNGAHRWQFRMQADVKLHDGTTLTAASAAAALQAACVGPCPWREVRAVGSSVVIVADNPLPNLPALLAGDEFLLAVPSSAAAGGMVGTGPFAVSGLANGVLTLTAHEACWRGRPFVDSIELRVHRAVRDQWLDLSVGRADLVEVPAELLRQAEQQKLNVLSRVDAALLVLEANDAGPLANGALRASIAAAVDRASLANVIYQKQGEATASLTPQRASGYAFLFPAEQDLGKAHALRGGMTVAPLTMNAEGGNTMQLAAGRIALDLRGAGFAVQAVAATQRANLTLRLVPLSGGPAAAELDAALRATGQQAAETGDDPAAMYRAERDALEMHRAIPLVALPRAFAVGARVRDLRLGADGAPELADAALEDAP